MSGFTITVETPEDFQVDATGGDTPEQALHFFETSLTRRGSTFGFRHFEDVGLIAYAWLHPRGVYSREATLATWTPYDGWQWNGQEDQS